MRNPSVRGVIRKYELQRVPRQLVNLPDLACALHFGSMGEKLFVWFWVPQEQKKYKRAFFLKSDDEEVDGCHYIGTTILKFGQVKTTLHLFEEVHC